MTGNTTPEQPKPENVTELKDMKKFERWRKSLQYMTGLGMSDAEQTQFRKDLDKELESYQCRQCENWRDNLMKNSMLST